MTTNEYIRNVKNNIYPPFDKNIWQRNYYEHIIRDEKDYAARVDYILNNPFNWEIKYNLGGRFPACFYAILCK